MRKSVITPVTTLQSRALPEQQWLDIENIARIELTSEDPNFPIESALVSGEETGWRAAARGEQIIRVVFDEPRDLHRIRLEFSETENERIQEFTLRCSGESADRFSQIVRQQWIFNPQGSTREIEDYQVNLIGVSILEIALKPDLMAGNAFATLARWRLA